MNYSVCRRCFLDWQKPLGKTSMVDFYNELAKNGFREQWIKGICLCHKSKSCNIPSGNMKEVPTDCPYYLEHLVGKDT